VTAEYDEHRVGDDVLEGDPTVASAARIYDYWLGGSSNLPVDREVGEAIAKRVPSAPYASRANMWFVRKAVAIMLEAGVRQFLNLGGGIPTHGGVHGLAQREDPTVAVVHVDIDAIAHHETRHAMADNPHADAIRADVRDIEAIFDHEITRRLINPHEPVGLIMAALLHFIPDADDPAGLIARYRDRVAPGSWLALSHLCEDSIGPAEARVAEAMYQASTPGRFRPRTAIEQLLCGFTILQPPGLEYVSHWGTTPQDAHDAYAVVGDGTPEASLLLAAVAQKDT
jgi:hypothetical protein